jgi:endoglucanase
MRPYHVIGGGFPKNLKGSNRSTWERVPSDTGRGATQNISISEGQMADARAYVTTFVLLLITALQMTAQLSSHSFQTLHGAIVRGDTTEKEIALVFTGDEYADGGMHIAEVLERMEIRASFFCTGKFYRNPEFKLLIQTLLKGRHYLGPHSDQHLLYCSWEKRDSLLVSKEEFQCDLQQNYETMRLSGIKKEDAPFFLPPYEWYNDSISAWSLLMGLQVVNFTHGTLSHTDYTLPGTPAYRSSIAIINSILEYESTEPPGLNGFILLSHIGTASERIDKFYLHLEELIRELQKRGYQFKKIDELL